MHKLFKSLSLLFVFLMVPTVGFSLCAEFKGKVDVAPAYIHIDLLESGKTRHEMDLPAVKADAVIFFTDGGWCLKPTVLYGTNDGSIFNGGLGFGHYTPVTDWLALTPLLGVAYTDLHAHTTIPIPGFGGVKANEKNASVSGYVGLEFNFKFSDSFRGTAVYQYSWSRSHTQIRLAKPFPVVKSNDHSEGPSYSVQIEKDLNKKWSVNLGAAYNLGLSKEKHGLRAYGAKIGIAYWFDVYGDQKVDVEAL